MRPRPNTEEACMLYYCDDESLLWSDAFGLSRLAASRIKTHPQGRDAIALTIDRSKLRGIVK